MNISHDVLKQRISSLIPPRNNRNKKSSKADDNSSNSSSSHKKKEQDKVITIESSDSENTSNITIIHEDKKSEKPKRFSFSYPKTESKPLPKKKSPTSRVITIEDSGSSDDDVKISSVTTNKAIASSSNKTDIDIDSITSNVDNSAVEEIVISDNENIENVVKDNKNNVKPMEKEEEEHVEENYIGFESSESEEEEKKDKEEEEDNKRKRRRIYEVHSRDILTPISVPPWIQEGKKYSEFGPQMLHEEIVDFVKYISPTPEEKYMREYALKKIKDVILDFWPFSTVETFGSYKTNLYLPTSDVDIVIMNEDLAVPSCFFDLEEALKEADVASKIEVIDKARIPIIKLVEKETGYHFDISANVDSGLRSARIMEKFIDSSGYGQAIISLVLVIKQFLAQRYMNEVFSGGLGSYAVFILVTNFIMMHPCVQNKQILPQENLGVLLLEFLELFGRVFNIEEVGLGISLKKGAYYYRKIDKDRYNYNRPRLLSIEDPEDPGKYI